MKFVSWNVNGFRACLGKGFNDYFLQINSDIFALQETKMQPGQADFSPEGYHIYENSAEKKGYSGTAVFSKVKPISVKFGLAIPEHDTEGRVITAEYENFYFVTVYTPNSQKELARLSYRMEWDDAFREYIKKLDLVKPVIVCGDLNVAHTEIDLKNPKTNTKNAGFTPEERNKLTALLSEGFTDSFRHLHPDLEGAYSWWSYMFKSREKNAGWRIDYFLVSNRIADKIKSAEIHKDIMGSDHCPVYLEIDI